MNEENVVNPAAESSEVERVVMRDLSCDQVAWILDAIDRYLPKESKLPRVSQKRGMLKHGLLYEIMDVANLSFEDKAAIENATPWILKIKANRANA